MNKIELENFEIDFKIHIANKNSKDIFLFLHGFADTYKTFKPLFKLLEINYNWAAFDFPGCGNSGSKDSIDLELYPIITKKFIEQKLGGFDITVISHSLGSYSALYNNKIVKKTFLLSPFNYNLFLSEKEKNDLRNRLLPQNIIDAKRSYLTLFYNPSDILQRSASIISEKNMLKSKIQLLKFGSMVSNQILNIDWLDKNLKPLFLDCLNTTIVTGDNDLYTPSEGLKKVSEESKINITFLPQTGHAIIYERSKELFELITKK
ncbi:alpha/beta hydrolase [Mycoplasma crocodyli]|uniref:Putative esterase/lipase n=1 Tax=Mycoplasma crocodyli (strain ATCC 51981 / MP145) TaxID=512564 RepID=D5E6G8_MYCCM|nr:alpha/beta hydrolase [Mycoplasma crocodyli]ADE20027.1 putative esterase/lipase [Mycoplasma crocodyli MP145]